MLAQVIWLIRALNADDTPRVVHGRTDDVTIDFPQLGDQGIHIVYFGVLFDGTLLRIRHSDCPWS